MKIKYIVVHCSDSPNDQDVTAEDIHRWHQEKGWDGIGYHYVITRNGNVENGRPLYWQGAHVKGYNEESIGICLAGRDQFTDEQLRALRVLLGMLALCFDNPDVVGHYELDPHKTCPNFDVMAWHKGDHYVFSD